MRRGLVIGLVLTLLFSTSFAFAQGETLLIWTTGENLRTAYETLAESWNGTHPERPISVAVEVYSRERIASKLNHAFTNGVRFDANALPALADIDLLSFPNYVFEQTTDLYPLQNLLRAGRMESASGIGEGLYTHNGICMALPYAYGELKLCYRLSLAEKMPEFLSAASSFEDLETFADAYLKASGEPLMDVDYLGGEWFSALYGLAGAPDSAAYDAAVDWLRRMHDNGYSRALPTGSAYGEPFARLMDAGEPACLITTAFNLLTLAQDDPQAAGQYGVLPLPSLEGNSRRVFLPATATAVINAGSTTILARQFLSYCRFSEEAKAFPALYIGLDAPDAQTMLSRYYKLPQEWTEEVGETISFQADEGIAERIQAHPSSVLR